MVPEVLAGSYARDMIRIRAGPAMVIDTGAPGRRREYCLEFPLTMTCTDAAPDISPIGRQDPAVEAASITPGNDATNPHTMSAAA